MNGSIGIVLICIDNPFVYYNLRAIMMISYLVKSHHCLQIVECPVAKGVVNTSITAANNDGK